MQFIYFSTTYTLPNVEMNHFLSGFPNRARRGLENKSYLDEGRMEKLEQMLKQTEQIANEAESKYEEVKYLLIDKLHVIVVEQVIQAFQTLCKKSGRIQYNTVIHVGRNNLLRKSSEME